ncbi:MAG: hypothetical protein ACLP1D_11910 [Xanthobacteraceae bacterium]
MQSSLNQAIERRRSSPAAYPSERFAGRGIVICAGGERYFTCAWVLISVLRRVHRTTLPIQVWHLGHREMSEEMRLLLTAEGVEVVDAETVVARHPARLAGGWPLKPYAIAHSRFREVLYLDADTVPLVDPQAAFQWNEYRDHGLLLWPDLVNIRATSPVWAHLGLAPTEQASIDSGVLLADKARAWAILDLAVLMNEHCDEIYDLIYGDKDTFLLSAQLLNRTFGFVPHRPFQFEWDMVQRDPSGEPFLHHRTGAKWLLHHPNRPLAMPALMPDCEAALAELRSRWSGVVFHAPQRSPQARAEEARLLALRNFRFVYPSGAAHDIELLPGGRVRASKGYERHWAVIDRTGSLLFQFYGDAGPTEALERRDDGAWLGLSCEPGGVIRLEQHSGDAASRGEDAERLPRSAGDLVGALAQPAWFAIGYDAERAVALEAALSLLNDVFDDVPEQIARQAAGHAMPSRWRGFLDRLAVELAAARDRRLALVRRDETIKPHVPDPAQYGRPA